MLYSPGSLKIEARRNGIHTSLRGHVWPGERCPVLNTQIEVHASLLDVIVQASRSSRRARIARFRLNHLKIANGIEARR